VKDLSKEQFLEQFMVQDAVIRNFEIIGEATKNISVEYRETNNQIQWKKMAGFRDKLIHNYFGIQLETIWLTIIEILPDLETDLQSLLESQFPNQS
jgi:uncharacterized protein with HEPN domain